MGEVQEAGSQGRRALGGSQPQIVRGSGPIAKGVSTARYLDYTGVPLLAARLVVGGAFVYMGYNKFREPFEFLKAIRLYDILPESPAYWLNGTGLFLPWLEMVGGACLILGVFVRGAALTLMISLMAFTAAVYSRAIGQFGHLPLCDVVFDCGCGSGPVNACHKMAGNIGLLVLSCIALSSQSRRYCLSHLFWRRRLKETAACPRCGFDLRGTMEPACPECAAPRGVTA